MAKQSYTEMLTRMKDLQQQAEEVRKQEIGPVIAKIQEAVVLYKITAEDIFGKGAVASKAAKSPRQSNLPSSERKGFQLGDKYWPGIGKRPNWFKDALAAGKTTEEMRI